MNYIFDTNLMLTITFGVLLANLVKHLIVIGVNQVFGFGMRASSSYSGSAKSNES